MTEAEYSQWLEQEFAEKYHASFPSQLASIYTVGTGGKYSTPWFAIQAILTHETFTCAGRRNARWMAPHTPVFHYEFQQTVGIIDIFAPMVGVFHASELVFTLNFTPLHITLEDRRVGRSVNNYWTSFASNGNPNAEGEVEWPQFVVGAKEQSFLLKANFTLTDNLYQAECNLWDTVSDIPPRDSFALDVSDSWKMLQEKLEEHQ